MSVVSFCFVSFSFLAASPCVPSRLCLFFCCCLLLFFVRIFCVVSSSFLAASPCVPWRLFCCLLLSFNFFYVFLLLFFPLEFLFGCILGGVSVCAVETFRIFYYYIFIIILFQSFCLVSFLAASPCVPWRLAGLLPLARAVPKIRHRPLLDDNHPEIHK